MKIGFTGTRQGMTPAQRLKATHWLAKLSATEFHHGDCMGADAEAHAIALSLKILHHYPTGGREMKQEKVSQLADLGWGVARADVSLSEYKSDEWSPRLCILTPADEGTGANSITVFGVDALAALADLIAWALDRQWEEAAKQERASEEVE